MKSTSEKNTWEEWKQYTNQNSMLEICENHKHLGSDGD